MVHLEPGVLGLGDDLARAGQLAVREHVAVDERTGLPRPVVRPGDAVVEQPPARHQLVAQEPEVRRVAVDPDVLGQPDRAHGVEGGLLHVAVVEVPHLGEMVEPLFLDLLLRPLGLLPREGHAECADAVLLGGVPDHPAPAAADVEESLAGLEVQLACDQVVLGELRLLEGLVARRVERAGVGHRRTEDHLVEPVGDVVVVLDHLAVALGAVPEALDHAAPARQVLLRRRRGREHLAQPDGAQQVERLGRRRPSEPHRPEQHEHAVVGVSGMHAGDVEVTGDVGACHAQVTGSGHHVGESALVLQVQADLCVLGAVAAAVVRREPDRRRPGEQGLEDLRQVEPRACQRGRLVLHLGHLCRTALS